MKRKIIVLLSCLILTGLNVNAATITAPLQEPTVGPWDIAQLNYSNSDTGNVAGDGNDEWVYVADDRETHGQTFTLSAAAELEGIWVKHVNYGSWTRFIPGHTAVVRVSSVSGSTLNVLRQETGTVAPGADNTFHDGGGNGTGRWIYIALDTPVLLTGGGTYAFDLTAPVGSLFCIELAGVNNNPYAGGVAYNTADNQKLGLEIARPHANGDRTFILNLIPSKVSPVAPAPGAVNVPLDQVLSWQVQDINVTSIDLYFGTDPNLRENIRILTGEPAATTSIDPGFLDYLTTYYWGIDAYEPNTLGGPDIKTVGSVWSFTTKSEDIAPVVDAGDSVITTLALTSSPNVLALNGSVVDDGTTPLTVQWEAYDVALGGGLTTKVTFADQTDPSTTVTISESGTYILNLSATDATGTVSDQIKIAVYDSDCDAAKATGTRVVNYYDRDDNCVVNLLDYAELASEWLDSTALTESYLRSKTVAVATDNALYAEYWTGISGTDPNNLLENSRYPASPNGSYLVVGQFRGTFTGDNYGQRIRGYIVPQTSGTYTFYIASDDGSRLFLSADTTPVDTNPAFGNQIAEVPGWGWTNSNEWTKYTEQKSAPVTLTEGQYYYVEVLHKEGTGGDNVSVGWSTDGGTTITVIPGAVLRYGLPLP
jgi:hypothetical protein